MVAVRAAAPDVCQIQAVVALLLELREAYLPLECLEARQQSHSCWNRAASILPPMLVDASIHPKGGLGWIPTLFGDAILKLLCRFPFLWVSHLPISQTPVEASQCCSSCTPFQLHAVCSSHLSSSIHSSECCLARASESCLNSPSSIALQQPPFACVVQC